MASGAYRNLDELMAAAIAQLRDDAEQPASPATWPPGGGTCGALIRDRDWSASALGPIAAWSPTLRTTITNIVNSPIAKMLMWGGDDPVMLYNDAYGQVIGHHHPQALGASLDAAWPDAEAFHRDILWRGLRGEVLFFREHTLIVDRHGVPEKAVFDLFCTPIYETDGTVAGVMCTVLDITARMAAQRAMTQRGIELQNIADAVPYLVVRVDAGHRYRFANAASRGWYGVAPASLLGRHMRDVLGETVYETTRPCLDRVLHGESLILREALTNHLGQRRRLDLHYLPSRDERGRIDGVHILAVDLEDTLRLVEKEHRDNTRFRTAMQAVHGVLWINSADGRMVGEQPGWSQLTGQDFETYQGYGWTQAVHPDDVQPTVEAWQAAVAAKQMFVFEHRVRTRDGSWRNFAIRALPILNDSGDIVEWVGVHTDITHQRVAEDALRAQAEQLAEQIRHREFVEQQLRDINETLEARVVAEIERRRGAEAKLLQAQKLETIGQLTGGVAHDFNNLLQVIGGNLQLLGREAAGDARAERRVANALEGVNRGARLASQLLAFGRRQALTPKPVNISRFVHGMEDMLRRTLGGAIEIQILQTADLWNSFIDPIQIESALLNLAINARDAMDGNGRLTIELANTEIDAAYARAHDEVTPGQYVMLAVSDTGCGVAPELVDKVFEPFFSTKPEGKGSGLGLSMVYGFVKQSGGHLKLDSLPGHGTTIRLYLPRSLQAEAVPAVADPGPIEGGGETILVVEDEAQVRATVVEMLAELGYRVLEAPEAASALAIVEAGAPIDLLFTDVVMPGPLKSPELALKARQRLPGLGVLFTSGYTENAFVHDGRLDEGIQLLSKPYAREALARKIRQVLAERPPLAAPAATPSVAPLRVLLVEDDELIRLNAGEMLVDAGFEVSEAASGEEALAWLADSSCEILVTDVNLPGIAGPELAIRARALYPRLGVVFASGETPPFHRDGVPGGIALPKPYGGRALLEAIWAAHAVAEVEIPIGQAI